MRRIGFQLTLSTVLVIFLCSSSFAEPVVIDYWGLWGDDVFQEIVDAFNERYEGRIEVIAGPSGTPEKLLTAVAGGAPPDVKKVDRFRVGSFASSQTITPLDDLILRDNFPIEQYYPATREEATYKGKVYAIPWNTDDRGLYYNIGLFQESGLDPNAPPQTWEVVEEYTRKMDRFNPDGSIERAGFVPQWGNWGWIGWLWAAGGRLLTEDYRTVAWNREPGIKALSWMQEWLVHYGGTARLDAWNADIDNGAFYGGSLGMMMDGSWALGHIKNIGKEGQFGVADPPRPAGLAGEPVTWSGGFALAIPRGITGEKREAAWEFIKYMTGHEAQVRFGAQTGQIPALRSAATSEEFLSIDPLIFKFVNLMEYSRFRPVIPSGSELWAIYADEVHNLLLQEGMPPEQILDQTAQQGQQVLDEGWARAESN